MTRISWAVGGITLALHLVVLWLPVIPAQDLPQHLAIVHVLARLSDPSLPFADVYEAAHGRYGVVHLALAEIARYVTADVAIRGALSVAAIGTYGAFLHLAKGPRGLVVAALVAWTPAHAMGFVPFVLAQSVLWFAWSFYLRKNVVVAALLTATVVGLHPAAGVIFGVVVLVHLAHHRTRGTLVAAAPCLVFAFVPIAFADLSLAVRWAGPTSRFVFAAWTILGPHTTPVLIGLGVAAALVVVALWSSRPSIDTTAITMLAISMVVPWGLFGADVLTFVDLRFIGIAFGLVLVAVARTDWSRRGALAVGSFAVLWVGVFSWRAVSYQGEADVLVRVVAAAAPKQTLAPVVFDDRSAVFAPQLRVLHFLPLHYTVAHDGITTQLWTEVPHLPLRRRADGPAVGCRDWRPQQCRSNDLDRADHVLVRRGTGDDDLVSALAQTRVRVTCDGRWCLYSRRDSSHTRSP